MLRYCIKCKGVVLTSRTMNFGGWGDSG